jgi:hypothetical protein
MARIDSMPMWKMGSCYEMRGSLFERGIFDLLTSQDMSRKASPDETVKIVISKTQSLPRGWL